MKIKWHTLNVYSIEQALDILKTVDTLSIIKSSHVHQSYIFPILLVHQLFVKSSTCHTQPAYTILCHVNSTKWKKKVYCLKNKYTTNTISLCNSYVYKSFHIITVLIIEKNIPKYCICGWYSHSLSILLYCTYWNNIYTLKISTS